jgi:hypothetical protein
MSKEPLNMEYYSEHLIEVENASCWVTLIQTDVEILKKENQQPVMCFTMVEHQPLGV